MKRSPAKPQLVAEAVNGKPKRRYITLPKALVTGTVDDPKSLAYGSFSDDISDGERQQSDQ